MPISFPCRASLQLEQLELREAPANLIFSTSEGPWHSPDNWLPQRLPGKNDTALIKDYAQYLEGTASLKLLHVGSKLMPAQLDVRAGSLQAKTLLIGTSSQGSGLVQQEGGSITVSKTEVGRDQKTRGRLLLKQGSFTTQSMIVGRSGFGSLTVAGGSLHSTTLSIGLNPSAANSFVNVADGQVQITGQVLVGFNNTQGSSLTIRNGSFSWGSRLIVNSGSTLYVEGSHHSTTWLSTNRNPIALDFRARSTLHVSLDSEGFAPIDLQKGRLVVAPTARLVVDLSNYALSENQGALINLVQYGSITGALRPGHVQFIAPPRMQAEFRQGTSAWQAFISRTQEPPETTTQLHSAFTVSPALNQDYIYVPSLMYDETEGLYKVWFCFHDKKVRGGDNIGYREHPQLEGLQRVVTEVALPPSLEPTQFDQLHVCDPTVYRDPETDTYFMLYGANTDGTQLASQTRIGLASSTDGGRTFRHRNDSPLMVPGSNYQQGSYGVGQPSVTRANDGFYYMAYTDVPDGDATNQVIVVRSASPRFTAREFVTSLSTDLGLGVSVDLLYDPQQNAFAVVANHTPISTPIGENKVRIAWFNHQWQLQRLDDWEFDGLPFSIGEGPALLANSTRQWQDSPLQTIMAGSISAASRDRNDWAYWVRGDLVALTVRLNDR